MPDHSAQQILRPLNAQTGSRKDLLILACAVDRVAWLKTYQATTHRNGHRVVREALSYLDLCSSFLPGYVGRWLRGANFVAQLGRMLGWLRL